MIIRFDDVRAIDSALVGGKAASLGRLTQAGFRVPPGFTVSTTAQAAFFATHGIDEKIRAFRSELRGLDRYLKHHEGCR